MLEQKLAEIGLAVNEARIYMELLSIGHQPVSVLAKRLGFNRTTTYSLLKSLSKKGFVAFYNKNNFKIFVANDPNCLISYVDRKCRIYDNYRSELLLLVPKYRAIMEEFAFQKPTVTYYEGLEGVKYVMYDALNAKGNCFAYLCMHKWFSSGLTDFLLEYKDFRIATKQIPLRAIVPDTPEVRAFFENNYDKKNKLTQVKYLSDHECHKLFENEMNIYDDKVAIINLERGQEFGVIIKSRQIAAMQKSIFQLAWKGLSI